MDTDLLLQSLLSAKKIDQLESALSDFLLANEKASFVPVGGKPNNRGAIEVAADPGRALIERITNEHDAILELEHFLHKGQPQCRSPKEAANAWLSVPDKEGLAGLSVKQRQNLAEKSVVRLEPGEGSQSRLITVIDRGIGIATERLETTILSINESNKIQKHYLAGTYGQGGSSTFAFSKYVVIASRAYGSDEVGFTIVKYEDLPADVYKTGRYVYLVVDGSPLIGGVPSGFEHGTTVRHFGYDLTKYTASLGVRSLYGMFGRFLFDPVLALRFENEVHGWNRTIKGARNALNGALDDGDDDAKGPSIDYNVPLFSVSLGDYGTVQIEYWVLSRPESKDGKKRSKPSENFVDPSKPIVLTHNGQNQEELTGRLLKENADLPFLHAQGRLIVHVVCDQLSANAKRLLFSSTREKAREGYVLELITKEVVSVLAADDELDRLDDEAKEQSLKERDEESKKQMRREVGKLLKISGAAIEEVSGTKIGGEGKGGTKQKRKRIKPTPIAPSDPPTFIRIKWDEDKDIPFYAGQRRYIRVETDANAAYHNSDDLTKSQINIAVADDLKVFGTSPLKGGRMRIGIECSNSVAVGSIGSVRVELQLKGKPTLADERGCAIVKQPEPKTPDAKAKLPDFEPIPVSGPDDDDWQYVCGDFDDDDAKRHASNAVMSKGTLLVYYSEAYPAFANEYKRFHAQGEAMAESFRSRYEKWLVVHALLAHQDTELSKVDGLPEAAQQEASRQDRCRHATIAAMMATQEIKSGVSEQETLEPA